MLQKETRPSGTKQTRCGEFQSHLGGRLDRQAGFSIIEVLIASVLLLFITIGIIPLFVRSVGMNQEGRFATVATSIASSEIERLNAAPFNSPDLTIGAGEDEILYEEWQREVRGEWIDEASWTPGDPFAFHRIIRIRQFSLNALQDGTLDAAESISGSVGASNPGLVQIKEIVLQVETGNFPGAASRAVTLRSVRGI